MKTRTTKLLLSIGLSVGLMTLSACGGGGSDSKKDVVAAPVGMPQGRVTVAGDPSSYCEVGSNTLVCTERGQMCNIQQIQFSDLPSLCRGVELARNSATFCGYQSLTAVLQQSCSGVLLNSPGQTVIPSVPAQPQFSDINFREVQCEFEGFRIKQGRFGYVQFGTGLLKGPLVIDTRYSQEIDLRNTFLGLDIGTFGKTKLIFTQAKLAGSADTITVSNTGLNKDIRIEKSGFAGDEVRIDAQSDDGSTRLTVACRGKGSFVRKATAKAVSQYVCTGKSRLGSESETINLSLPYNLNLNGSETELAENLTMTIQDNRVQLTAKGVDGDLTVQTSAFLKEQARLTINDFSRSVNVTCSPK